VSPAAVQRRGMTTARIEGMIDRGPPAARPPVRTKAAPPPGQGKLGLDAPTGSAKTPERTTETGRRDGSSPAADAAGPERLPGEPAKAPAAETTKTTAGRDKNKEAVTEAPAKSAADVAAEAEARRKRRRAIMARRGRGPGL
jgi:hypothetical protein